MVERITVADANNTTAVASLSTLKGDRADTTQSWINQKAAPSIRTREAYFTIDNRLFDIYCTPCSSLSGDLET